MSDPTQDYQQVIADFELMQSRYEAALLERQHAEENERKQREAYFHQQQHDYEQRQKRDRRCQLVQKTIDTLGQIIQEVEWGDTVRLNEKLRNLEAHIEFQLRNKILENGQ